MDTQEKYKLIEELSSLKTISVSREEEVEDLRKMYEGEGSSCKIFVEDSKEAKTVYVPKEIFNQVLSILFGYSTKKMQEANDKIEELLVNFGVERLKKGEK